MTGIEERDVEIKLKTFGSQKQNGNLVLITNACCSQDINGAVVGVCFVCQDLTGQKLIMEKYTRVHSDYVGILRSPCALIPPIFMMDDQGRCVEWNDAMQKLSGLKRAEAIDRMLVGEVFAVNSYGCQVRDHDTLTKLKIFLSSVVAGEDVDKLLFGFFHQQGNYVEALLSANTKADVEGKINGVLCFLHVASPELQYAMQAQRLSEHAAASSTRKLAYIRRSIKKPLSGMLFVQNLMDSSAVSIEQKQLLKTSALCREQLAQIVADSDIGSIEERYLDMNVGEFNLGEIVEVVINQVMMLSQERQVHIVRDAPAELSSMVLNGDNIRLQQVLSDFLTNAILFTPIMEGSSVTFRVIPRKKRIGTKIHIVRLEFRIIHPSPGVPEDLIKEMFHQSQRTSISREGLGLYISQRLVTIMSGTVQYLREAETSSFIIGVEFPASQQ